MQNGMNKFQQSKLKVLFKLKFEKKLEMARILTIDTTTKNCSLALSENGLVIESIDHNEGEFSHSEKLHVFIEEICIKANVKLKQIDAIAINLSVNLFFLINFL